MDLSSLENRVRTFTNMVREGRLGFHAETDWWLISPTAYSLQNHPESINLLDQLGISVEDMISCYTTKLKQRLGID